MEVNFNDEGEDMTTEERVKKLLAETLCVDLKKVVPSATWDDLGADSLDMVEVIMTMEEAFDVEVADEVAEKIANVAELVNHITEITEVV